MYDNFDYKKLKEERERDLEEKKLLVIILEGRKKKKKNVGDEAVKCQFDLRQTLLRLQESTLQFKKIKK